MESTAPSDAEPPRVYLDVMLGKLATMLRMAGWDAAYALDRGVEADQVILEEVASTNRLLITRDRQLAGRAPESVLLTTRDVEEQVAELREAGFTVEFDEPTRCSNCNGRLESVSTGTHTPEYAPESAETDVWRCRECSQHFWKGSHWDDVRNQLGTRTDESRSDS